MEIEQLEQLCKLNEIRKQYKGFIHNLKSDNMLTVGSVTYNTERFIAEDLIKVLEARIKQIEEEIQQA